MYAQWKTAKQTIQVRSTAISYLLRDCMMVWPHSNKPVYLVLRGGVWYCERAGTIMALEVCRAHMSRHPRCCTSTILSPQPSVWPCLWIIPPNSDPPSYRSVGALLTSRLRVIPCVRVRVCVCVCRVSLCVVVPCVCACEMHCVRRVCVCA